MRLSRSTSPAGCSGRRIGQILVAAAVLVVAAQLPMSGSVAAPLGAVASSGTTGRLLASLANPNPKVAAFGAAVAVAGKTTVVGNGNGGVYIYTKGTPRWPTTPSVVLSDPNGELQAQFGESVAILGSTIVVGAPAFGTTIGAAYMYVKSVSGWPTIPTATLTDPSAGDDFGRSVAVSATTAIVGADSTASGAGVAYVYAKGSSGWSTTPADELVDPPENPSDFFGGAVALSGTTAVVGASGTNSSAGAAYIFGKGASGWLVRAALSNPGGSIASFGGVVSISGTAVLVGDDHAAGFAGAAYIYLKGTSGWPTAPTVTLSAPPTSVALFGQAVSISGTTALIGVGATSAFIYIKGSSGWPTSPTATLSDPAGTANDGFGMVAAESGTTAVVGALYSTPTSGEAYIYRA